MAATSLLCHLGQRGDTDSCMVRQRGEDLPRATFHIENRSIRRDEARKGFTQIAVEKIARLWMGRMLKGGPAEIFPPFRRKPLAFWCRIHVESPERKVCPRWSVLRSYSSFSTSEKIFLNGWPALSVTLSLRSIIKSAFLKVTRCLPQGIA